VSVRKKNIAGHRIRQARSEQEISQDDLSGRLAKLSVSIDRAGIAKIESGTRRVYDFELQAFSRALKKPITWLFGD